MTRRKRLGLVFGVIIIALIGLGYYGNSQVNRMIDKLASSGLVEMVGGPLDNITGGGKDGAAQSNAITSNIDSSGATTASQDASIPSDATAGSPVSPGPIKVDSGGLPVLTPEQNQMVSGAEKHLGRRVDRRDVLTAGNIVIRNFSWSEINYLYNVGNSAGAFHLSKDAHQVRNLLLSRLGPGEIATLTSIGNKYGLRCRILDPNWDIDKHRYIN